MSWSYRNRREAGERLIERIAAAGLGKDSLVLAIPNGGVAVAGPVVAALECDLDLLIVRKLQIPFNPEAGFGALTSLGNVILNKPLVSSLKLSQEEIEEVQARTQKQIDDRKSAYSGHVVGMNPSNRDVILIDDGIASGYTMLAAIKSVQEFDPKSVTVAVPTASEGAVSSVAPVVDRFLCPRIESGFSFAVAAAYEKWYDVPDSEVLDILQQIRN